MYIFRRTTILYTTYSECIIIIKQTVQIHNDLNIEVQSNLHVIFHRELKARSSWPEGWYWPQAEGQYSMTWRLILSTTWSSIFTVTICSTVTWRPMFNELKVNVHSDIKFDDPTVTWRLMFNELKVNVYSDLNLFIFIITTSVHIYHDIKTCSSPLKYSIKKQIFRVFFNLLDIFSKMFYILVLYDSNQKS